MKILFRNEQSWDNSTDTGYLPTLVVPTNRAGHFRYFLIFSITKNDFLHLLSS